MKERNMELQQVLFIPVLFVTVISVSVQSQAAAAADNDMAPLHELTRRNSGQSLDYLPADFPMGTLKNATPVVCSDVISIPGIRLVQMTDAQMKAMFQDKGGNYVREYMASTLQEAHDNFPNIIMLSFPFQNSTQNYSVSVYDNYIAKQLVMEDMQKLMFYFLNKTSSNGQPAMGMYTVDPTKPITTKPLSPSNAPSTSKTRLNVPSSNPPPNYKPLTPVPYPVPTPIHKIQPTRTKTFPKPTLPPTTSDTVPIDRYTPPSRSKSSPGGNPLATMSSIANLHSSTSFSSKGTTHSIKSAPVSSGTIRPETESSSQTPETSSTRTTTSDPRIAQGIEQLFQYVNGSLIGGLEQNLSNKEVMDTIWKEANTRLHPVTLLGLTFPTTRTKRQASDGSSTTEQYCQIKGALTSDHRYMHLCSSCGATTKLSEDFFPRFINEAVCKQGDSSCVVVGGIPHGECKQNMFVLNMLQRRRGHCAMVLHNGQRMAVDDWQLTPKAIRVACECTINKLSVFKQYVVPVG